MTGYDLGHFKFWNTLIHEQRAPIVGHVCMDQCVVDVSHIPGVRLHDEVVLVGQQGEGHIPTEEVARWAETINYEVTTSLLPRVVRVYLRRGREIGRLGAEGPVLWHGEQNAV